MKNDEELDSDLRQMMIRSPEVSVTGSPESGKVTLTGLPPWILEPGEDPKTPVEAEIVKPTAVQENEGLAGLKQCLPIWMQTPALLAIKEIPLGLIVAVIGSVEDEWGFKLRLKLLERLVAPSEFNQSELEVGCLWNQPYMTFNESQIWANYCFSLHFGAEGVDKARKFSKSIPEGDPKTTVVILRFCFEPYWPDDWDYI